jgi:pyruvate dehydrogenase E2 component (dihydrolipoamide acetyltransferase)
VLIMPRQGNTVESCIIVRWKAAEGAAVAADEAVCEVETDKASFDVPAGAGGVLLKILRPEGDDVPVLEPIAVIGREGEDWTLAVGGTSGPASVAAIGAAAAPADTASAAPAATVPAAIAAVAGSAPAAAVPGPATAAPTAAPGAAVSPRARKLAAAEAVDASALQGTGPGGRVIERDVAAAIAARPPLTAAAKAALAAGAAAPAGGPGRALGGRAGIGDLSRGFAGGSAPGSAPAAGWPAAAARGSAASPGSASYSDGHADTPVKGIRKLIAERMRASLESTAQLSYDISANAKQLQALRARFKASDPALGLAEVTIGDLVLYAVSRVLPRFPFANATLENGVLRSYERVHLAMAVDTPRGLMVPVIRNADLLSLREISAESKRLAAACQAGSVNPDELSGGTFTVSNLGAFGIESFTPVLNAPQVALLGVNAITPRAAAGPGGTVVLEQRIGLSLTADHQVIDGAPAARLIKALADAIADIDLLLMA